MLIRRASIISHVSVVAFGICLGLVLADYLPSRAPIHEMLSRGSVIVALGSEPGWRLEISGLKKMQATLDYGDLILSSEGAAKVVPLTSESVLIEYSETKPALTVIIIRGKCVDDMKGDQHDLSVAISYGGNTYTGCGDLVLH